MQHSNSIEDISNDEFRWILTEHTQYLKPFPLPKTDVVAYTHQYIDFDFHKQVGNKELASMLVLLIAREYIWPIVFNNSNILHPKGFGMPFFIFTGDIKLLPEQYEYTKEYSFDYFDINETAKVLEN
jgi:hypothetical protein